MKNRKIAIIGSSPLMMMLAYNLIKKKNKVTVFEYSNIKGGAWAWFKDYIKKYNFYFSKYSNAIVPLNKREDKFVLTMNNLLKKKYKIKIKKTQKEIKTNFFFKKKFIYNFTKFYIKVLPLINFRKEFIFKLENISKDVIKLNNNLYFDKVFFPSYAGVKKIIKRNKVYIADYKEIISEHLFILGKKFKFKNFYYSDFYDENFDRIKLDDYKKFFTLTMRLNHKIKGTSLAELKKNYVKNFIDKKDILEIKKSKFHNFYRNKSQLVTLKNILKGTNIKYVDTTQFVCGFYKLKKILEK